MTTRSGHASYCVVAIDVLSTFNITELPYEASITNLKFFSSLSPTCRDQVSAFPNRSPQRKFPFLAASGGLMATPASRHWKVMLFYLCICYDGHSVRSNSTHRKRK
jgi:hypothetical protein